MGFRIIQTGYWPIPFTLDEALQLGKSLFIYLFILFFFSLKIYLLWKIWPISVKRWKPLWTYACSETGKLWRCRLCCRHWQKVTKWRMVLFKSTWQIFPHFPSVLVEQVTFTIAHSNCHASRGKTWRKRESHLSRWRQFSHVAISFAKLSLRTILKGYSL